jgi:hypothetical protein
LRFESWFYHSRKNKNKNWKGKEPNVLERILTSTLSSSPIIHAIHAVGNRDSMCWTTRVYTYLNVHPDYIPHTFSDLHFPFHLELPDRWTRTRDDLLWSLGISYSHLESQCIDIINFGERKLPKNRERRKDLPRGFEPPSPLDFYLRNLYCNWEGLGMIDVDPLGLVYSDLDPDFITLLRAGWKKKKSKGKEPREDSPSAFSLMLYIRTGNRDDMCWTTRTFIPKFPPWLDSTHIEKEKLDLVVDYAFEPPYPLSTWVARQMNKD